MSQKTIIVGAGVGGLAAAMELAAAGMAVTVLEAQQEVGGKARAVSLGGHRIDMGPSVLTMRPVFEALFALCGTTLAAEVGLRPLEVLCHHRWPDGTRLNLTGCTDTNFDAIANTLGAAAARGYRRFAAHAQRLYALAAETFIFGARPSVARAALRFGRRVITAPHDMDALRTLDTALHDFFPATPQLRQLFGRYATYVGASPLLAPASLALICEVERQGVWALDGGISALVGAMATAARALGVDLQCGRAVRRILTERGAVVGVELVDGTTLGCSDVVFNGDIRALGDGRLWPLANEAPADDTRPLAQGLSHIAYAAIAEFEDAPPHQHNVLFAPTTAEFDAIFSHHALPDAPTVYLCAPDRAAADGTRLVGEERLFCLTNAPTMRRPLTKAELQHHLTHLRQHLSACGLPLRNIRAEHTLTPWAFGRRFAATDGAIYGEPPHGWRHLMGRASNTTRMKGLFVAGGSVHPGPGVPMAALSGRQAAQALLAAARSTPWWRPRAMRGGTSTPKATTAATR